MTTMFIFDCSFCSFTYLQRKLPGIKFDYYISMMFLGFCKSRFSVQNYSFGQLSPGSLGSWLKLSKLVSDEYI